MSIVFPVLQFSHFHRCKYFIYSEAEFFTCILVT